MTFCIGDALRDADGLLGEIEVLDAGYSDPGIVANLIHHDEHGGYAGATYTGLLGEKKHYNAERGYVGESWEGLVIETTAMTDDYDSPDTDSFFGDDDW